MTRAFGRTACGCAAQRAYTGRSPAFRTLALHLIIAALASLAGCAATPLVVVDTDAPRSATAPETTDGKRTLAPAEAAAVIKKIERGTTSDLLSKHLALVESHVREPLVINNKSRLLVDGPQTHTAMFQAMEAARVAIDLETYILEGDGVGEKLAVLLERKRKQGVTVRVLYDGLGSISTPGEYFERLKAAGIAVCAFNPVSPAAAHKLNNRDHRKILVVDRRTAFTGGVNISSVYSSGSFGGSSQRTDPKKGGWRDTHLQIEGPAVDTMLDLFESAWKSQRCEGPTAARSLPVPGKAGNETMRVIAQDPQAQRNEVYVEVLSAIAHAELRAWLTFGYFVPDPQTVSVLKGAAQRGVDVRILVPSQSDVWLSLYAGRSHYADLLEAGVRIFERQNAVLHAKTAVVDGVWSTVGTSNLDWRSFVHNYEVNVVVLGPELASALEELFKRDLAASHEVTAGEWAARGMGSRVKELFSRAWAYFL